MIHQAFSFCQVCWENWD